MFLFLRNRAPVAASSCLFEVQAVQPVQINNAHYFSNSVTGLISVNFSSLQFSSLCLSNRHSINLQN